MARVWLMDFLVNETNGDGDGDGDEDGDGDGEINTHLMTLKIWPLVWAYLS